MAAKGRILVAGAWGAAAFALGVLACAGTAMHDESSAAASEQVKDVVVESEPGLSRVTLVGLSDPVFTAFQQADPDRLMVDLTGVAWQASKDAVEVNDGTIREVTVAPFASGSEEPMLRVQLSLVSAADYDVRPGPKGLVIEVSPLAEMGALDEPHHDAMASDVDPWSQPAAPTTEAEAATPPPAAASDGIATDAPAMNGPAPRPASTLERVEAAKAGNGVVIHLVADGSVDNAASFTLSDPPRLVIDLAGVKSVVKKKEVAVGGGLVQRVRIGAHDDKVRVVLDGAGKGDPFDGRRVVPVPSGLVIALGEGAEVEAAMANATADVPIAAAPARGASGPSAPAQTAASPEAGPAHASATAIEGVAFEPQADRDRVLVRGEQAVDYIVYEPDPDTVVLSLTNATLEPGAAVRIAPDKPGPVSLVTAFEQPDMKTPEVRVVMKRAANLKPAVTREGSTLVVEFPHEGQASPPPVLALADAQTNASAASPASPATLHSAVSNLAENGSAPLASAAVAPASTASGGHGASPGAVDEPASIDILNEGGLMDGKQYVGRRISLDFKEVEIADVLRLIAEVSDLNVIAGDEVKGKVTIRLVDVPWDQALDVILLTKGLGFARIGNVLRIAASDVLSQEEELRLQERRAKEKLEDLVVKLQPVNYADVKEVSTMVTKLLTERGSVNTDKRTNTLIIKDIASVIDEATALVKAVDTMTPQVMIEAKIVEANLDFSRELGAVWNFGTNPLTESTLGGRDYVFNQGDKGNGNQLVLGNPITAAPTGLINLAASVIDSKFNYELQIQAAESNGDGKVISSPRVVTVDNGPAQIEQGVSIPFQTTQNGDTNLEFVDAVLKLKVTPHITADKSIVMQVEVSRNAPDSSVFTLTGSPAIAKNDVKTETLVKDGQTLVLGGIYVVDKSEKQSRMPYLHSIPFIGNLFKEQEVSDSRKELLIFVTPRVVESPTIAS
ncbi:MAG TPA: type IV pilus secretin PilQ [Myxococcota bacterium]|nr:type IV pilus secretin PilQ [Myxococcota bacterium]